MNKEGKPFVGKSTRKREAAGKPKLIKGTFAVPARVGPFRLRGEERDYKRSMKVLTA